MFDNNRCIFCNNNCKVTPDEKGRSRSHFECDICGIFDITQTALALNPPRCLPKISAVLKHKTLLGKLITIGSERKNDFVTIDDLEKEFPKDIQERLDKVLINLSILSHNTGAPININENSYSIFFTDSKKVESLFFVLNALRNNISRDTYMIPDTISLTSEGWSNIPKEKGLSYNIKERILGAIYEEEQNDEPDLMGKITYSALGIERNKFHIALEKLINEGFLNSNKVKLIPGDNTTQGVIFGTTVMTREGNEYARKLLKLGGKGTNNQETEVNTKEIEIDTKSFDFWQLIHPEICNMSKNKFEDGYYADAVETALKHINKRVKDIVKHKTGKELDGAPLMQYAFSLDNPIIKLNNLTNDTEKNIQKGYLQIFAGTMTGIRNPKAHDNLSITKENAIHLIFLVSLLMYKLDKVF